MDAPPNASARYRSPLWWLGGYLLLWFVLVLFLGALMLSGQLRQAEEGFTAEAVAIYRDLDSRLAANEYVLDGAAAFLRAAGVDNASGLEIYAREVLARFPHIHLLSVQRGVQPEPALAPSPSAQPALVSAAGWPPVREAVDRALRLGRAATSEPLPFQRDELAYVLVRPVVEREHPRYQDVVISMIVRPRDLLPTAAELGRDVRVQLRHVRDQGGSSTTWTVAGVATASELERRLLPRFQAVRVLGSETQPFELTVNRQVTADFIDPFVAAAFLLAALSGLLMAISYGRVRVRRETERRRSEQRLYQLANFDSLTGLPNRNLLKDRLHTALFRANRHQTSVALYFIDLDGFKAVNDTAGHEAGDKLLQMVSERLLASLRAQDTVARLSGDEFVVLIEDVKGRDDAERVLAQLKDAFIERFAIGDFDFLIDASIGLALYPEDAQDPATLLRMADEDMYAIKYPEWVAAPRGR